MDPLELCVFKFSGCALSKRFQQRNTNNFFFFTTESLDFPLPPHKATLRGRTKPPKTRCNPRKSPVTFWKCVHRYKKTKYSMSIMVRPSIFSSHLESIWLSYQILDYRLKAILKKNTKTKPNISWIVGNRTWFLYGRHKMSITI